MLQRQNPELDRKGRRGSWEDQSPTDVSCSSSLQVYPTPMRALGMGTSGSLCRIGAMVAPFISQVPTEGAQGDRVSVGWGKGTAVLLE